MLCHTSSELTDLNSSSGNATKKLCTITEVNERSFKPVSKTEQVI